MNINIKKHKIRYKLKMYVDKMAKIILVIKLFI